MGVGCRAPAGKVDLDHTVDHAAGGATIEVNLRPACHHDHDLKHKGGWGLRAIDTDTVEWTSRLGHTYLVKTPPVIDEDLPDPEPDPAGGTGAPEFDDHGDDGEDWQNSRCWYQPPPKTPNRRWVEVNDDPPPRPKPPPEVYPDEPPF